MQRWNVNDMWQIGNKLFEHTHKRKHFANPNHDIHFLARQKDWLEEGIHALALGNYSPRPLKRLIFDDGVVDQLHLSDRVLQHIFLKQIKPTFQYVMNPNCYHLHGPTGVKYATQKIQQELKAGCFHHVIRADIRSFYASIPHYKLINDIKENYDDPRVVSMLIEIIKNPIETLRGYSNPIKGIALRGPLSQFFSGLYLKPLDDALSKMDVTYIRYQDDILVLCKTKRQLNRCRRILMNVLHERRLSLSRKKTVMGPIGPGFHFLGIHYLPTQTDDNTKVTQDNVDQPSSLTPDHILNDLGGGKLVLDQRTSLAFQAVPHPRTLRKAREQVRCMVNDGVSHPKIKAYLLRWLTWWSSTGMLFSRETLASSFLEACKDQGIKARATCYLASVVKGVHPVPG